MATTIVDPVSRIEGHLKVKLEIIGGEVTDAEMTGNMYRGFENFLVGQSPVDAPLITQRVCGVCPTAHAVASVLAIDDAAKVQAPHNGRIMRNLIHGAEYIHSHLLHTYHLALQDYIDMAGALNQGPWAPLYGGDRRITGGDLTNLIGSYVTALEMRRKAHTVGAIVAGKQPHAASIIAGGCSANLIPDDITNMTTLVTALKAFIEGTYLPDLDLIFSSTYYEDYHSIGAGSGKLLSYGVFRQGTGSTNDMLIKRGIYNGSVIPIMDHNNIVEDVDSGWYTGSDNLHPLNGVTNPDPSKVGGYSWLKAPRYKTNGVDKEVYEVGPLARMVVNGDITTVSISVADREKARGIEALKVADAMLVWLTDIGATYLDPSFIPYEVPPNSTGVGLTEAIRGAIGHWVEYDSNSKISHYQIITPTCWNASPRDGDSINGTIEQALIGISIADENYPIEALRVIHSYDPCLACAVHVVRPKGKIKEFIVR